MIYLFVIILGFVIGLSYPLGIEPLFFKPLLSLGGMVILSLVYLFAGWWLARKFRQTLLPVCQPGRRNPGRDKPHTLIYKLVAFYRFAILLVYILEIYVLHWPLIVKYSLGINLFFLTDLLVLAPFLITLVLSWIPLWQMDCAARQVTWGLGEYLIFHLRFSLLVVVIPLLSLVFLINAVSDIPSLYETLFIYPFVLWIMVLVFILLMYIFAPLYLKSIWRLKTLPAGPLRVRLEGLVKRSGLTIRDLLVWKTGRGRLANALVVGLLPQLRYIVFTDTLLNHFAPEEVEAVLGHEIGHAQQRHLLFYFLFGVVYILMAISIESIFGGNTVLAMLNILLLIFFFWGVLFRIVARHLEMAADLYSAQLLNKSSPINNWGFGAMINALEKLVLVNGSSRKTMDLMHPSIARRVDFLMGIERTPFQALAFRKKIKSLLIILSILFIVSLGCVVQGVRKQIRNVPQQKIRLEAVWLAEEARLLLLSIPEISGDKIPEIVEKHNKIITLLKQAIILDNSNPYYYLLLGETITMQAGVPTPEARAAYEAAWRLGPIDPMHRMHLAEQLGR